MTLFVILLTVVFIVVLIMTGSKDANQKNKEEAGRKGALFMTHMRHFTGLPIGADINCKVFAFNDKIVIEGAGTEFTISRPKITAVNITSEADIQNNSISSVGGAVGGALLFGPVGAMIGGRTKNKQTTTINYYMIISYLSDEELKYIAFDLGDSSFKAIGFVEEYKVFEPKVKIEL